MISLSICIPTFNRLECLDNCLNSILISSKYSKNFKFEVCISDNHSEKNPETIIKKYHDLMIEFQSSSFWILHRGLRSSHLLDLTSR